MSEFLDPMRRDRAAGMEVRVDQRSQCRRRFHGGIKRDAKLAEKRQIRTKAGRDDDAVDRKSSRIPCQHGLDHKAVARRVDAINGEGCQYVQPPGIHGLLGGEAERAAFWQLVVEPATKKLFHTVPAKCPEDFGAR